MSQFQQPRQPAPGVVDLGTGRQARMSQSNMNAGAFGSRGVTGGQSLRGTDSARRGNNVDPLAYLLGSAAQGMQSFVQSEALVKQSYEKRAKEQLQSLENARLLDEQNNLSPEEVTDNHLKRLRDFKNSNSIDKDLDAYGVLNSSISKAQGLDDTDTANAKWRETQTKLAEKAHSQEEQRAILEALEADVKKTPRVAALLKDKIHSSLTQVQGAIATREYAQEKMHMVDALKVKRKNRFDSPTEILEWMSSKQPPILTTDENRLQALTEAYFQEFFPDIANEQDPETRKRLEEEHFDLIAPMVIEDLAAVDQQMKMNAQSAERVHAIQEFTTALEGGFSHIPVDPAELVQSTFAKQANLMYDQLPPQGRRPRTEHMRELFLKQGVEQARDSATPLKAFHRMRRSIPTDVNTAMSLGWAPRPDENSDKRAMTQEEWDQYRDQLITDLRGAQIKAASEPFARRVQAAGSDIPQLMQVAGELADLAGVAHPIELFSDPNAIGHPHGMTQFGEEYNALFAKIATPLRRAIANAEPDLGANDYLKLSFKVGPQAAADAVYGPGENPPPEVDLLRQEAINFPTSISTVDDLDALENHLYAIGGEPDPSDPTGQTVLLAGSLAEFRVAIDAIRDMDPPPGEGQLRGLVQAANMRAWANGPGPSVVDGKKVHLVPAGTRIDVRRVFRGHKGGPLTNMDDAAYVANLYLANKDNPELLEEIFDDNLLAAEITAEAYEGEGGWNTRTLRVEDGDGTPVFANPVEINMEAASSGFQVATPKGSEDSETPVHVAEALLYSVMNPDSQEAMDNFRDSMKDGRNMAILGTIGENGKNLMEEIGAALGIDTETHPDWAYSFQGEFQELAMEIGLEVATVIGNDPAIWTDRKRLGETYAKAIKSRLSAKAQGKAFIGGVLVDDVSGSLRKLSIATKSNDPSTIWTRYSAASMHSYMRGQGMTEFGEEETVSAFYEMFPDFADDGVEAADLMARAREMMYASGRRNTEISVSELLKASLELSPSSQDNPFTAGDDTMYRDAVVRTEEGAMVWTFPNIGKGDTARIRFLPPINFDSQRAVLPAEAVDAREQEIEALVDSNASIGPYNAAGLIAAQDAIDRRLGRNLTPRGLDGQTNELTREEAELAGVLELLENNGGTFMGLSLKD